MSGPSVTEPLFSFPQTRRVHDCLGAGTLLRRVAWFAARRILSSTNWPD